MCCCRDLDQLEFFRLYISQSTGSCGMVCHRFVSCHMTSSHFCCSSEFQSALLISSHNNNHCLCFKAYNSCNQLALPYLCCHKADITSMSNGLLKSLQAVCTMLVAVVHCHANLCSQSPTKAGLNVATRLTHRQAGSP